MVDAGVPIVSNQVQYSLLDRCNTLQHAATHCNTLQHTLQHEHLTPMVDVGVSIVGNQV